MKIETITIITTLTAGIILILLLSGVHIIIKNLLEPEFKITKEGCYIKVNQSVYDNCVAKYDGKWDIEGTSYTTQITPTLKDGLILFEFSKDTSMSALNIGGEIIETKNCINVELLYKFCGEVEVEEIVYCYYYTTISFCPTPREDCIEKPRECVNRIISKKELTTEWLDENCGLPFTYTNEDERSKSIWYECGEYIVEVGK